MFNKTESLRDKGLKAAQRLLEHKGYEVLGVGFNDVDIVAKQDDTLVFIKLDIRKGGAFGDEGWNRANAESNAFHYLEEYEYEDNAVVRFDYISMLVNDKGRALVRHHINCFDERVA